MLVCLHLSDPENGSWTCAVFLYYRNNGQEDCSLPKFRLGMFLLVPFSFPLLRRFMVSSVPLKYVGCSFLTGKAVGILRWRVMDLYQLRIALCCALIPSCLAGKFIVKMMLSILCFLKDHHFFAYFWSSCLPGFMVITCSVGFFVRTLVALKLTVNSLPCHISD